ncbi:hypothetical protein HPP92_020248 [Vanilla planifolia]|uniref:NAC domain-containing protein n=1 Tax=Vanilla planifolia TaxID=51239 RepID=A0A835Q206_VANPL|nr:hypothetical protein HPP92_020248 [Vanilla planifolia]
MARAWLINSRGIAKKVKNASSYSNHQIKDLGAEANRECPRCKHVIDNSDVSTIWPGLPAGVKFDPSDAELIGHLAGKAGVGRSKGHIFIDEFIPTIDGDQGICYTHPKNLPGVKKDGSISHFFHRTSNAYATGHKKRRKIHGEYGEADKHVRWHKTGKTKPVVENGIQKGWKKIMVLYRSLGKGCKPDKANWVMHQYHLGTDEEEKDGEFVVSKIFYQNHSNQMNRDEAEMVNDELDLSNIRSGPRTPKTVLPQPPRSKVNSLFKAVEQGPLSLSTQVCPEEESTPPPLPIVCLKGEDMGSPWWPGESEATEKQDPEKFAEPLLCHEVLEPFPSIEESSLQRQYQEMVDGCAQQLNRDATRFAGFPSIDDIDVDTPPDMHFWDLQFGSQDSLMTWLDRL